MPGADTVELVRQGEGILTRRKREVPFYCPEGLRKEILWYAEQDGISQGPVFINSRGSLLGRQDICREMKEICQAAGISQDKGNPGSLLRLYQETQEDIIAQLKRIHWERYNQMVEEEQDVIGWLPEETPC